MELGILTSHGYGDDQMVEWLTKKWIFKAYIGYEARRDWAWSTIRMTNAYNFSKFALMFIGYATATFIVFISHDGKYYTVDCQYN